MWSSRLSLQFPQSSKGRTTGIARWISAVLLIVATSQISSAQDDSVATAPATSETTVAGSERAVTQGATLSSFVILDPDRLFAESSYGLRVQDELNELARAIQAENGQLTRDLEAEELDLLAKRDTLTPEEFRDIADAFDEKVQSIRDAQDRKGKELTARANEGRQSFNEASLPVLRTILTERNALGILDSRVVFLPADSIDITNEAILRVDQVLKDGLP